MDLRTFAHLGRYREIVSVLWHYGFDEVVQRLELPGRRLLEKIHPRARELNTWERIRKAMEELGPAFIKAGQFLSMRHDLLPPALLRELRKLQDEVPPEPFAAIRQVVEANLGKPLSEIFLYFEEEPLAAASLAQVHRAMLHRDRQVVAVKIQRPNIPEIVRTDLEILEILARRLNERMESMRVYNLPNIVQQIRRLMLNEIDFSRELRNMRIMHSIIADEPGFFVPAVFPEYSTPRVLTMELAKGKKLKDIDLEKLENRHELARRGISIVIKLVLDKGFFHADPHPGNFLIDTDGTISLLDWGMVGRLPAEVRYDLIDLVHAFVEKDTEEVVGILLEFVSGGEHVDRRLLENEVLENMNLFHHLPLKEINLAQLLNDTTRILREQGLILSADLAIMIKALVTAEGTARQLYPDLDTLAEVEPFIRRLARERYKAANLRRNLLRDLKYLFKIQKKLPASILEITDKIERGDIAIRFRHEKLEGIQHTFDEIANRMILGLITASLFIASGLIIFSGIGPTFWGYPSLGVIGFLLAGLLATYLVIAIFRSQKH
jgi:ubiquinone biosynthesis protein